MHQYRQYALYKFKYIITIEIPLFAEFYLEINYNKNYILVNIILYNFLIFILPLYFTVKMVVFELNNLLMNG